MASYKLQQALEIEKYWKESKYTDTWTVDKKEWTEEQIAKTQIIEINNVNIFIYEGRVTVNNLPANGAHHWKSARYKVSGIKTRPYVTVGGKKCYLDEITHDGDYKVCVATTTKTEEWKYYCIGMETHFTVQ